MSKIITSMTIESELFQKFKSKVKEDGQSMSFVISKMIDEYIGASKLKDEQLIKETEEKKIKKEKEELELKEFSRKLELQHSKMTPEELEQEKKDRERIDRMAALSYSGVHVSDEEWRSGVLNKDKVIETRPDTSEFADPEEL